MPPQVSRRSPLLAIFLTVFLDMLGLTIIIPVLPALFFDPENHIFQPEVSESTRSMLYGLLIASYPFMQFFGAPILGALSDQKGRKPILSIALVGTMIGYVLFGIAIMTHNLWLLFFSRMLPGFTGGNISIVLSAIADISEEDSKAKNFGMVGAAFGLGFILGPTIGGILADNTVVSWFNHQTPFWFTAILTFLNLVLVYFAFPETLTEIMPRKINPWQGLTNIATSFKTANLRGIFTVVLCLSLGFSFFAQFFSVYLIQKFGFAEKNIGFLYGWIGIWLVIAQAFVVRRLSNYFDPGAILRVSAFFLAVTIGSLLLPENPAWFYVLNPLVAVSQGITSPNLTAFVSRLARPDQQGEIIGINQSMISLGQMVPPIIAGYINALNQNFPLMASSGFIMAGWLFFLYFFKTGTSSSNATS